MLSTRRPPTPCFKFTFAPRNRDARTGTSIRDHHPDSFATKFTTGSYFELKIYGFTGLNGTGTQVGEVDFYLANYTSSNSLPVNVWTLVDLSSLAGAQSLTFDYASSDVGPFGINTPEYFAMDDLTLSVASVPEPTSAVLALIAAGAIGLIGRIGRRRRQASRGSDRADSN